MAIAITIGACRMVHLSFDNGIGRNGDSRRRGIKLRSDRLTRSCNIDAASIAPLHCIQGSPTIPPDHLITLILSWRQCSHTI